MNKNFMGRADFDSVDLRVLCDCWKLSKLNVYLTTLKSILEYDSDLYSKLKPSCIMNCRKWTAWNIYNYKLFYESQLEVCSFNNYNVNLMQFKTKTKQNQQHHFTKCLVWVSKFCLSNDKLWIIMPVEISNVTY